MEYRPSSFSVASLTCMIDLHLHLDGAISPASARQLAQAQGIPVPESEEALRALLEVSENCRDLNEFLEKFAFPCSLLQTEQGLRQATQTLLAELKEQGVQYAEIRFAPQKSTDRGLTQMQAVEAVLSGMACAPLPCQLILCCMRGTDNDAQNRETVLLAQRYLHRGVCAVDLAGAEGLFPTRDFAGLFSLARQLNVPFTIHAGEADGADSVAAAVDFGARRIGHGVRCVEDAQVLRRLVRQQIPLELCPTSNLNTAVFPALRDFPLPALLAAGAAVTVNTDDPSIEGTSIKAEYQRLIDCFGLTRQDVKALLVCAANAAFLDEDRRQVLLRRIHGELDEPVSG